jgi:hypothetical protein
MRPQVGQTLLSGRQTGESVPRFISAKDVEASVMPTAAPNWEIAVSPPVTAHGV